MNVTVTIDRQAVRNITSTLDHIARESNQTMIKILPRALRFAVQSAAKATPQAKRRKMKNLGRMSRKRRQSQFPDAPWWAEYIVFRDKPGAEPIYAGNRQWALRARVPELRGLSRTAWWWGYAKAQEGIGTIGTIAAIARSGGKTSQAAKQLSSGWISAGMLELSIGAEVTNSVWWLYRIAPQAATIGVQKAEKRMLGLWERQLQARLKKAYI